MQTAIVNSTELAESMLAGDHIRKRVTVPPEALTQAEQDTLLLISGSMEKVARVPASAGTQRQNRAWSMGGAVD